MTEENPAPAPEVPAPVEAPVVQESSNPGVIYVAWTGGKYSTKKMGDEDIVVVPIFSFNTVMPSNPTKASGSHILFDPNFFDCGIEELRALDYIMNKAVDVPNYPVKMAEPANSSTTTSTQDKTQIGVKKPTTSSTTGTTGTFGNNPKSEPIIDYSNADIPDADSYHIETAAKYFIPSAHQFKPIPVQPQISQDSVKKERKYTKNISHLFEPKTNSSSGPQFESLIKPIKVNFDEILKQKNIDEEISTFKNPVQLDIVQFGNGPKLVTMILEGFVTLVMTIPDTIDRKTIKREIIIKEGYVELGELKNYGGMITFHNAYPKNNNGIRIPVKSDEYIRELYDYCSSNDLKIVMYNPNTGDFSFEAHTMVNSPFVLP